MRDCIVVIPTYNEVNTISPLVTKLISMGYSCLIVDDSSPDGTGDLADVIASNFSLAHVLHRENGRGYAGAVRDGFNWSLARTNFTRIAQIDADGSHPAEKLPEMLRAAEDRHLVIGSRYVEGGGLDTDWPVWRKALSQFGNAYARLLLGLWSEVRDLTGGFRVWDRDLLRSALKFPIQSNGYVFQIETAYIAIQELGCSFQEIPIYFRERSAGESKMCLEVQLEAARRVIELRRHYAL